MSIDALMASHGRSGHPREFLAMGRRLEETGEARTAATAYDRAFGLDPRDDSIVHARRFLLDRLAVVEHGLTFRYIPAGTFLMGSEAGDPDELPVHAVRLGDYWLSESPVTWAAYCDLMGWSAAPRGMPAEPAGPDRNEPRRGLFALGSANKIRLRYCQDAASRARDWQAPAPEHPMAERDEEIPPGAAQHDDPNRPRAYDERPMVSVSWQDAEDLCERITTEGIAYRLPTEAEWEKAARGGRIGSRYPWGDEPPDASRCDFDRFGAFSILPSHQFPPNDYGLYAMSGGVWEWTSDWYDAEYYRESPARDPRGPADGAARVLRGGSWADCAEAVTVSFRMARAGSSWRTGTWGGHLAPNIGFRLCRVEVPGR